MGDGSGFAWNIGCGWGCAVVDRQLLSRKLLWGGWNFGTVGVGELMPYLHALMWYQAIVAKKTKAARGGRLIQTHIISDNETVVRQGNRECGRDALAPIWAGIDCIARQGYDLRWHWIERDRVGLNDLADMVSKMARRLISVDSMQELSPEMKEISVYDVNPF